MSCREFREQIGSTGHSFVTAYVRETPHPANRENSLISRDQAQPHRDRNRVSAVVRIQLFDDAFDVVADRLVAPRKERADLPVSSALGEVLQYLEFARNHCRPNGDRCRQASYFVSLLVHRNS